MAPKNRARDVACCANCPDPSGIIDVLNRSGRGVRSPLDGLREAVSSESGGIIRTGWHKSGGEVIERAESRYKQSGCCPSLGRRLRLRPTRTGFIQVSLNKS